MVGISRMKNSLGILVCAYPVARSRPCITNGLTLSAARHESRARHAPWASSLLARLMMSEVRGAGKDTPAAPSSEKNRLLGAAIGGSAWLFGSASRATRAHCNRDDTDGRDVPSAVMVSRAEVVRRRPRVREVSVQRKRVYCRMRG
jgi:hypothetical protein